MVRSIRHEMQIVKDAEAVSRTAAEILVSQIPETVEDKGSFAIALSGGSTPKRLFSLLANEPSFREAVPWDKVHFFWGDERHVPPEHQESNYRMARDAMLSRVPVPAANVHRIKSEIPDASKVAEEYEEELRNFFNLEPGEWPRFDCVLLGMGPDGHTASLFPGAQALDERERLVIENWVEKFKAYRITLTAAALNNADAMIFLVSGEEKAPSLREVLEGNEQPDRLPAQLIRPTHGNLLWLVDRAAASGLTQET